MENLIFTAYAYVEGAEGSTNLSSKNVEVYLKNVCVSLISAKIYNPDDSVALITNINVPLKFKELLEKNNILILFCEFNEFRFSDEYKWNLAFYKLCVLEFLAKGNNYDNYLLLDSDTVTIKKYEEIWRESEHNILLFDLQHSLYNQQAINMRNEHYELLGINPYLTNWGGEFFCINKNYLPSWMEECKIVFNMMRNNNFQTFHGDEFIIYLVASQFKSKIKNANAYISRYWTDKFYLVSTDYFYNKINIIHLPAEKNRGLLIMFKYLEKHNKLPKINKMKKILNLPTYQMPKRIYFYKFKLKLFNAVKSIIFLFNN